MNKTVKTLVIIYLFQGIIHNLGHPVTPTFVESLGIEDYWFGVFFALMSLGLTIGGLVWGVLGDRGNKRIYMFVGLLFYSLGQFMFAYVGNVYWMVFFRFVSGFGVAASVTLLISHTIEYSDKRKRGYNLAFMAAAFTFGSSIGYLIGGKMPSITYFEDLRNVFYFQALVNVVHGFVMYLLIIDEKSIPSENPTTIIDGLKAIRNLDKTLIVFLISLTFITVGTINISKFLDVYFRDLGYDTSQLGDFVFVTGMVSIFSSLVVVPFILKLNKNMTMMKVIQIVSAIIIFIVFRSEKILFVLYTLFMAYVIVKIAYQVLEQNYISDYASEGTYGAIMGVRQAFFAIGMFIGPIVGGVLYYIKPIYVFDFSVFTFMIGFLMLLLVSRKLKQEKHLINE